MVQFYHAYPEQLALGQQAVAKLSWAHNVILLQKIKDIPTRLWYARQTLAQGWSRDTLLAQIENRAHERQGTAITNFAGTLPEAHAAIAQGLLKDPYLFDFLTLEEPFHERELETGLLLHIQKFLLELGRGFAFVGRQYRLEVSGREFHLDLLFYHLHLRCFFVVDLKKGEFNRQQPAQHRGHRDGTDRKSEGAGGMKLETFFEKRPVRRLPCDRREWPDLA